jgi:phosphoglycerate dehydrogenase-like enzyme
MSEAMASDALLLLVGVPENYRLGGPAFQRLHQAHPRVQVRIVHDPSAFAEQVPEADAVIGSRPYLKLCSGALKPEGRLRWVQTTTAGVDQALTPDLLAAGHVTITCIKGPPGPMMAEHAVLLMLALSRNFPAYVRNQQNHIWKREGQDWPPLHGHTIAILGVGSSGGNLARVCKAGFGMTVLGMTRTPREHPHIDRSFGKSELLKVLPEADFVVLCLPNTPQTQRIIDSAALDAMKPTAYLVNVSRGALIDEGALIAAMRAGRIAGAGLDVTTEDPIPRDSPLWELPNTIITPHIATESVKLSEAVVDFWCENVRRFAQNEPLLGVMDRQTGY